MADDQPEHDDEQDQTHDTHDLIIHGTATAARDAGLVDDSVGKQRA
jgi:hypothetical protein